ASIAVSVGFACVLVPAPPARGQSAERWKAHDMTRPRPPVVAPLAQALPVPAPPDAVVLFDGKSLAEWRDKDGGPAKWVIKDGAIEAGPRSGYIYPARGFGGGPPPAEGGAPPPAQREGPGRGNNGGVPDGP